jgi:hypothetical protein
MDIADTVPAAEFVRNFGRYKMQAQQEAVPVTKQRHTCRIFRVATRGAAPAERHAPELRYG